MTAKRISQSEASTKDSTSASTNQKRPRGTAQAHQPIRGVHEGQLSVRTNQKRPQRTAKRTNQSHSFMKQRRRRSSNQIRLEGSIGGRLVTPEGSIGPSQSDSSVGISSDGLSSDGLSSDGPSIKSESSDQPIGFIGRNIFGRNFFGRTFFGRTLHQVGIVGSANQIHRSEYFGRTIFGLTSFRSETPR